MIKKILFIFITVFTFSNVSAQNIVIENGGTDCGNAIHEYELIGTLNGKNQYQGLATPTALGLGLGATSAPISLFIAFNGTDWVLYQNLITNIVFEQVSHTAGILPPDTGWVGDGNPCSVGATIEVLSGGVLNLPKESIENNKINIFPNPSSDFISVSNINEVTSLKITNIAGQTVMNTMIDGNNNDVDIRELSKGFYFVEIAGKKTIKFIKK